MALLNISEPGQSQHKKNKKNAVGIDLGTTNSLIATVVDGQAETLTDQAEQALLPSVVHYAMNTVQVGCKAQAQASVDPLNTIQSVKRLMGKSIEDIDRKQWPYEFINSDDDNIITLQTTAGPRTPVEISADILSALGQRAKNYFNGELDGVVITVPAYFDDAQRQATKDAATLAGFNVLRLLNEPTAAALAYGLDQQAEGVIAVYDLGGGTFDISILRLHKGVFEVLATGGNSALGGDDVDQLLVQWLLKQINYDEALSSTELRNLLQTTCDLKLQLSSSESVSVSIASPVAWQGNLSREQFNDIISPLIEETLMTCQQAIIDAEINLEEVNDVVLVGGSTRIPLVREKVGEFFQREPLTNVDPDKVVAIGAAIQADILAGNKSENDMLLLDVIPLSLGIETMGGLVEKIIARNTTIPVSKAQKFTTFKDGQTAMSIHVLQGERELVNDCRSLARFELRGIPPMTAGAAQIQVTFQVDADGLLNVMAQELSTGVQSQVQVKPSYGLSDKDIANMLQESYSHAKEDMQARQLREQRTAAEQLMSTLKKAIEKDGDQLLTHEEKNNLLKAIETLAEASQTQDYEKIAQEIEQLNHTSEFFAQRRMDASIKAALQGKPLSDL